MVDTRPLQTVYLIAFPEPEQGPSRVERLQEAFGLDEERARHFLDNMPLAVKRRANPDEALHYAEVLKGIGAKVQITADARTGQMARIVDEDRPASAAKRSTPDVKARREKQTRPAAERRSAQLGVGTAEPDRASDGLSFWESIRAALRAPLTGKGPVWTLAVAGLLWLTALALQSCVVVQVVVGMPLWFAFMGLLGLYFSWSVRKGLRGLPEAPDLPDLTELSDMRSGGLVLTLFSALIFSVPGYLGATLTQEKDVETRAWMASEKFVGEGGENVVLSIGGLPQQVRDTDGNDVIVDPRKGTVTLVSSLEVESAETPWQALLLFFVGLLVPLFYLPMALTVAGTSERVWTIFNPLAALGYIFKGGVKYAFVAGAGSLVVSGGVTLMALLSTLDLGSAAAVTWFVSLTLLTLLSAYCWGVQGHLLGRLLNDEAERFGALEL